MKVMITGHRPDRLGGYNENNTIAQRIKEELKAQITHLLADHPDLELITGLAQGVDTWFAEIGLENDIPVHAYIPFSGQQSRWPKAAQDRYSSLLRRCSSAKTICDHPSKKAFLERNDAMIHDCEMAIAVWDGSQNSGTGYTVRRIQKSGKSVVVLHPENI